MRNNLKIGLFGFGCVGKGLHEILCQKLNIKAEIVKICVKNPNKDREIGLDNFTYNKDEILNNPEINVIVELTDDAEFAFEIVCQALQKGKAVVTANKKMVAEHLQELLKLQNKYKTPILYEAAVCASIPVIRNLEEYYDNDLLKSVKGIVNGTTNYILSQMFNSDLSFEDALQLSKEKGYAESNPSLDIDGFDAKYKLNIILAHAFGLLIEPKEILNIGISRINNFDAKYAKEKGMKIKLIAQAFKNEANQVAALVIPQFIDKESELYSINDVFNGIITESRFADKNFFVGKGAGAYPTASAVLSDISALSYQYKYEYKKLLQVSNVSATDDVQLEIYARSNNFKYIDRSYFDTIIEEYSSKDANYIIGTISLKNLKRSPLIDNPNVSIILKQIL